MSPPLSVADAALELEKLRKRAITRPCHAVYMDACALADRAHAATERIGVGDVGRLMWDGIFEGAMHVKTEMYLKAFAALDREMERADREGRSP